MLKLSPRIIMGAAGVVVLLILFSLAQEMNRRLQIQKEVDRLEEESRALEKTILGMENLNQYFRTEAFQERMAREKLNFRAPGEKVVLIAEDGVEDEIQDQAAEVEESVSVMVKWWNTFFGVNL